MTNRRWVALLSLIAAVTVEASHLPVLGGEITASAAKVFLTAATAGDKPESANTTPVATAPATAVPAAAPIAAPAPVVSTTDAHSTAAVPPTLNTEAPRPASPNVLRPTPGQLEARVTPTSDEATAAAGKSSRRTPTLLPTPTPNMAQTPSPTLAPPQPLTPAAPNLSPVPHAAPLLVAEKPARPLELKPATPEPAVTKKIEPTAPTSTPTLTAPTLTAPTLTAPISTPISPTLIAPTTPAAPVTTIAPKVTEPAKLPPSESSPVVGKVTEPKDDAAVEYDPTTGKTYRNVLRGGETTNMPTPAVAAPAAKPQVIELTPSFESAAKPLTGAATPSTPAAAPSTKTGPSAPAAVVSDKPSTKPAATPTNSGVRPNTMLSPGDEPPSQRAVVSKTPAQAESKKLFESQEQQAPLTADQEALKRRVQQSLATYYQNWTLNTREHSPWEVMHAIIAYGVDTRLILNSGTQTTAIGHLCFSGVCNKQAIVTHRNGKLYMNRGPGVQGHAGQFLAIVAQSQLQRDYPLYVGGQQYTLEDLIKAEQYDCESGTELTFKLIGLMHYLPSDAEWTNFQGQKWSLDRLVREEIVQPVRGAACGGTHRLMGLSYAIRKREQRGEPITGIYKEAEKYIAQYHKYTRGLQNPDGSFSTAWFVRREARLDLDRRLQTTGHILEWLCFSLSDEQLREPWVTKTVTYVTNLLLDENHEWEIGHLGHALHALQIYNERVYGGPIRSYEGMVSRRPIKTAKQATPSINNQ